MNTATRKAVEAAKAQIEKIKSEIEDLSGSLGDLREQEQEFFDDMPESSQVSGKGIQAEANIDKLDDAAKTLEASGSALDDTINALDQIK